MKSYKELMNQAVRHTDVLRELTDEESSALKKCILDIYCKIAAICDHQGLTYMLAGGSCLGAVRHKGFIPWDDDLDMLMPRPDYQQLIVLLEGGILGDEFIFTYPNKVKDSPSMFLKVYKADTVMMGLDGENSPYPQKVFVDIFPLDGYSSSVFVRKCKGFVANSIRLIANMVSEARPMTDTEERFYSSDKQLLRIVKIRRFLGRLLSIIGHRKWVYAFDRLVRNDDMSGLVGIPTGRKLYNGEVFPANVYLETVDASFEKETVHIPKGWDDYLKNLYKDYMQIPEESKRERHPISVFSLPRY